MGTMTPFERVKNVLDRQPVDELPYHESIWGETWKRWTEEGHVQEHEDAGTHFGFSIRGGGWLNSVANLDFETEVLEETEETILSKNGNYASLRNHKQHSSTPEHVDFEVKDRENWEKLIKPHLLGLDERRINFENYRNEKQRAAEQQQFFCWNGVAPFEQMHPVCGHEYMCMGMALDPDWVKDMVMTFANLTIRHLEVLFEREGTPDGCFFFEDMGFKQRPFMSPDMYNEIMFPGHQKLFDFAHSHGCKVIVHSCGFVQPLVPGLIEAGMDCLQAMEVKAGMDLPTLAKEFGDRIAFFGGIDVRDLISNDKDRLKAEMDKKIIPLMELGGGYIVHSDHSIPPEVDYETLCWFFEEGKRYADYYRAPAGV